MKKLAVAISAILGMSVSSLASADFYLGGKLGQTWLDDNCSVSSPCDDDSISGGIFAGYDLEENIALEAGYDRLGNFESNFTDGSSSIELDGNLDILTLAPKFHMALTDNLEAYLKLGLAWINYDNYDDDFSPMAAIGGEYMLSENWVARLEYQHVNDMNEGLMDDMDANSIFFGFAYRFGADKKAIPVPDPIMEEKAAVPVTAAEPVAVTEPILKTKVFKEFGVELFATDSAALAAGSEQYFGWLVDVMKKYPQANAAIVGHTDSSGSEAYNLKLSQKRAQAVANYLTENGIDASRLTVTGAGESSPKASNDSPEGREQNRRVEVTIEEFEYQE
ncbi:OmpA family protein [Vibrio sp. HA2012]|uniref:OmpA family protein n=1 Tax=Vibrio sp. HA2012 TaxID=1971595 RepID=UPI0018E27FB1|nr:OmpA family protein [Vibrio sp. HA2012]